MGDSARVIVKKIYLGRALLFGLYLGIIAGICFALLSAFFLSYLGFPQGMRDWFIGHAGTDSIIAISLCVLLGIFVIVFTSILVFSGIYNLTSKLHGSVHLYMEEVQQTPETGMK